MSSDRTVLIWNTSTGEVVVGPLQGHECGVLSVAFSPDASQLATGAEDGSIRVWNLVSGELAVISFLANLGENRGVLALAWTGEKQLICAAYYKFIVIFNPVTGSSLYRSPNARDNWIRSITTYCEGRCIATGSEDGHIILWDTVGEPQKFADAYAGANEVYAVAASPNGCYLAGGYRDHNICLLNLAFDDE